MPLTDAKTPSGVSGNGPDPHLAIDHLGHISNTAVDQNTGPAIEFCQLSQLTTDQCTPVAAATIHHQHPTLARRLEHLANHGVVLEDLERHDRARHDLGTTVVLENWGKNPQAARRQPVL